MTRRDGYSVTGVTAVALAVLVALAAVAPVVAIPQPDDGIGPEQTASSATVAPGETVTFEATVNATGYNAPGLAVDLPDGWTIQSQSADGPATYKSSTNEWVWLSGDEYTVTYTVAVPDDAAGDYAIAVDGSAIDPESGEFASSTTTTTLTVQEETEPPETTEAPPETTTTDEPPQTTEPPETTATPDPAPTGEMSVSQSAGGPVAPGGTVTMTAEVDAAGLNAPALDVDLPDGWTIQSQTADGPATYKQSSSEWVWLAGDVSEPYTVEYVVAVPGDAADGDYTVTAAASALDTDDQQVTDSTETTVSVAPEPGNQAPIADAGADQTASVGDTVALDAGGSTDPDGDSLSYDWTQTGGPDVSLSDASAASPTFTAPDVDGATTLTFQVEVADGNGATATDTVSVTVQPSSPPAAGSATVSLSGPGEVVVGDTATFDVVVSGADNGVGAYDLTVDLSDASAASIADVQVQQDPMFEEGTVADDGSGANVVAVGADATDSDTVTVATVTLEAQQPGSTDASLTVDSLGDASGTAYDVTATNGASVTVTQVVVGDNEPATDVDGDGTYEDVNGDGEYDVNDVQVAFTNRNDPAMANNPELFDFNGDGEFDILDIQALIAQLG